MEEAGWGAPFARAATNEYAQCRLWSPQESYSASTRLSHCLRLAAPYGEYFIGETSLRASNALAKAKLCCVPNVPTYREGIQKIARVLQEMSV